MTSVVLLFCILVLLSYATNGFGNPCMHCLAQGEERTCDESGEILECNESLAEKYFSIFLRVNENLDIASADKKRFQCFSFMIQGEEAFYLKGCTYESLPICDNIDDGMSCSTCKSADCNTMYFEEYYNDGGHAGTVESSFALTSICSLFISLIYFVTMH